MQRILVATVLLLSLSAVLFLGNWVLTRSRRSPWRRIPCGVVLALGSTLGMSCALSAQSAPSRVVRIAERPMCATCRIEITPIATLGAGDGPGSFEAFPTSMVSDSQGRIFVAFSSISAARLPAVYNRSGRFLRELGKVGEGPGEFRRGELMAMGASDTVFVFDRGLARRSTFVPNFTFVSSTLTLPSVDAAVQLRHGEWVINAEVRDRDRAGLVFHVFGSDGTYRRSFGNPGGKLDPNQDLSKKVRRMWPARDGGFWSVPWTHHFVIEHWSALGHKSVSLKPSASWFRPYEAFAPVRTSPTQAPMGRVAAVFEDDAGLLWILGQAADARWTAGLGPARRIEGQTVYEVVDRAKAFDGLIEVYDPRAGVLLASRRVPEPLDFVLRAGVVAGISEDADGRLRARVSRLTLVR